MWTTKEIVHANVLNRATTAGYVGGDGVVLVASHPDRERNAEQSADRRGPFGSERSRMR
jgi:hypothetical protein